MGCGESDALRLMLRRLRARLASEGASYAIAHEIVIVEVVAKRLGVYEELEEEIEELKMMYAALYAGERLSPRVPHEQRFQRMKRGGWRAARLGHQWA